jgi:hypothetical protein
VKLGASLSGGALFVWRRNMTIPEINDDDFDAVQIRAALQHFNSEVEDAKRNFGEWDSCDPVVWTLLRTVQAQNALAHAIAEVACYGEDERILEEAIAERLAAIAALQEAIKQEPRGFQ